MKLFKKEKTNYLFYLIVGVIIGSSLAKFVLV